VRSLPPATRIRMIAPAPQFVETQQPPKEIAAPRRRPSKKWLFRFGAVAIAFLTVLSAEGVCRLAGWGKPTDFDDPTVGFRSNNPLFVLNDSGDEYRIARSRRKFFARESFPAVKGEKTFRIFSLGGSTVQGRPYSTPTSFTAW